VKQVPRELKELHPHQVPGGYGKAHRLVLMPSTL
jgi:hypothetical protein